MSTNNQDFAVYNDDNCIVGITIADDNGAPIDVSECLQLDWEAFDGRGNVAVTKNLATGISFVADGTDGQIQIALTPADLLGREGWFFHAARGIGSHGEAFTFEAGRLLLKVRALGD